MDDVLPANYLSENFSIEEATVTQHARAGRTNIPTADILHTMKRTALKMEKVRLILGNKAIIVSSWYRSPAINKIVGGSVTSQHMAGEAVDFVCPRFGTAREVFEKLKENKDLIRYDQLIYEYTWVHISFAITSRKEPRGQAFTIKPS